jgi:Holliday junction resolvase
MTNKHYIKGRKKEYDIIKELKDEGFTIAQRSAGSHSPIDVWAVNPLTKVIKLVQCKPDNFSESQKNEIYEELGWLNNIFRVEFEIK